MSRLIKIPQTCIALAVHRLLCILFLLVHVWLVFQGHGAVRAHKSEGLLTFWALLLVPSIHQLINKLFDGTPFPSITGACISIAGHLDGLIWAFVGYQLALLLWNVLKVDLDPVEGLQYLETGWVMVVWQIDEVLCSIALPVVCWFQSQSGTRILHLDERLLYRDLVLPLFLDINLDCAVTHIPF